MRKILSVTFLMLTLTATLSSACPRGATCGHPPGWVPVITGLNDTHFSYYASNGTYGTMVLRPGDASHAGTYRQTSLSFLPNGTDSTRNVMHNTNGASGLLENSSGYWTGDVTSSITFTNRMFGPNYGTSTVMTFIPGANNDYFAVAVTTDPTGTNSWTDTLDMVLEPVHMNIGEALAGGNDRTIYFETETGAGSIICFYNGAYTSSSPIFGDGTWTVSPNGNNLILTSSLGIVTTTTTVEQGEGGFTGTYSNINYPAEPINFLVF